MSPEAGKVGGIGEIWSDLSSLNWIFRSPPGGCPIVKNFSIEGSGPFGGISSPHPPPVPTSGHSRRGARNSKSWGKICQKKIATTWRKRFFTSFFSPVRGKHVFIKKLWGISPTIPPLAPPLVTPTVFIRTGECRSISRSSKRLKTQ